jgi:hypothetical protein
MARPNLHQPAHTTAHTPHTWCPSVWAARRLVRRTELERALLVVRRAGQLVVNRLDRLGRSLAHLIELAAQLRGGGIGLVVLQQAVPGFQVPSVRVLVTTYFGKVFRPFLQCGSTEYRHSGQPPTSTPRQLLMIIRNPGRPPLLIFHKAAGSWPASAHDPADLTSPGVSLQVCKEWLLGSK